MNDWVNILISVISYAGGIVTILFTRKKYIKEVDNNEIQNLRSIIDIQQLTIISMQNRIQIMEQEIKELYIEKYGDK